MQTEERHARSNNRAKFMHTYITIELTNSEGEKSMKAIEILSKDQRYLLHLESLELLKRVGVRIPIMETLKLMEDVGCVVDYKEQIVKLPPYLVEECVRKVPHRVTLYGRDKKYKLKVGGDNVYFGTAGFATRMLDLKTGKDRPMTKYDLIELTKLADALDNVQFYTAIGQPLDVPLKISDRYQWAISLENTRKHVMCHATGKEAAKDAIKMASIVTGGEEELRKTPITTFVYCLSSPLAYEKEYTEAMIEMCKFGLPLYISSGPMAGVSSPVTLSGTLIVNNAELLSAVVLTRLINPEAPMIYASWARPTDMRTGRAVWGPENCLLRIASSQLARYYNIPCSCGGILSDSKVPDAQAGYEKALTALIPALAKTNLIKGMGLLDGENAASLEQLVIDNEIVGMISRILRGVEITDETLAADLILKVGCLGSFLTEKHTLKHYKDELWIPKLSDRLKLDAWKIAGAKTTLERAKDIAMKTLREHEVPPLSKDIHTGLWKLVEKAERKIKG